MNIFASRLQLGQLHAAASRWKLLDRVPDRALFLRNEDQPRGIPEIQKRIDEVCGEILKCLSATQRAKVLAEKKKGLTLADAIIAIWSHELQVGAPLAMGLRDAPTLRLGAPLLMSDRPPPKRTPKPAPKRMAPRPSVGDVARRIQAEARERGRPLSFGAASVLADDLARKNRSKAGAR
jgi:hypothetical protein